MTEYEQGFKQAEEEFKEKLTKMVKGMTLATLEQIEAKKSQKARVEEELRILKLDLEDLKNGRLEKVKERQKKSEVARNVSRIEVNKIERPWSDLVYRQHYHASDWTGTDGMVTFCNAAASGTYTLESGKTYYIEI